MIYVLAVCLCFLHFNTEAQSLPGKYTTTWAGNSLSGNPNWVQGYMLGGAVSPSGKVYTIAHWDESGKTCGIYQNGNAAGQLGTGGFAITTNNTHVFAQNGSSVKKCNFDGTSVSQINLNFNPSYLAANQSFLVAADNGGNGVAVFNLSNGTLVKKWTVKDPGAVAIDSSNNVWVVSGVKLPEDRFERKWLVYDSAYVPRIYKFNSVGVKQADSISLYAGWRPACMTMDRNTNQLMVGDDGPKHQLHFFDISGEPSLKLSFGTEGGISAGDPGIITPLKFWALKGTGTDSSGNIYVVLGEDGSVIRTLKPNGDLNWELNAANFVDVLNFDAFSDGRFLYGKNEIVEMDYDKTSPGKEWSMYAYTQDRTRFPEDPRNFYTSLGHDFTSVWPRIIEGDMYLFTAGMYGIKPHVFKFTGKVASPAAYLQLNGSNAFFQDKEGSVWEANGSGIIKTPLVAIEKNGDLIYGKAEKVSNIPVPFSGVSRILFDEENDVMFLTGSDNKIARYNNWSKGNRTPASSGVLDSQYNQCMAQAGDYIFTCGVRTRARIKVYSASDFKYLGMLEAGAAVGGADNAGWVDIPYGLNAIKRSNGEYIVSLEDDGKMKSVIFRWCPTGDCLQGTPTVRFSNLVNKNTLLPGESLTINATAEDKNGTIDSIQLYADTILLATSKGPELSFTWQNISEGKYYLLAKAIDNDRLSATSYPVRIYVNNPDTVKPTAPLQLEVKETAATYANLSWEKSTDNIGTAGYKILRDGVITYVSGGSGTTYKATGLLPNTTYVFTVVAFDKSLNLSSESNPVIVRTNGDGPYLGVPVVIPGKIEAEWYDKGGEGVAYHDATPEHNGASFRGDEGVDMAATGNGYYVGWTEKGEWLRFTVDVAKEGDYDVIFQTAGGSGSILMNFSNGDKSYTANYSGTPDWNIWTTNVRTNIHLLPGTQFLKVKYNNAQFNLDYLKILDHENANLMVPSNLHTDTIVGNSATLKWEMPGDVSGIKEYRIYKNGIFQEKSATKTFIAKNLTEGQSYQFTVSSVSLVGNESEKSNVLNVSIKHTTAIGSELIGSGIQVFPNPTKGKITIKTGETIGRNLTISLTDLSGHVIFKKYFENNIGEFSLPTDIVERGMYLITIQTDNVFVTRQVVVQ